VQVVRQAISQRANIVGSHVSKETALERSRNDTCATWVIVCFSCSTSLTLSAAKPKSMEDFIRSQYYEGFVKFGRSCVRNEYLEPENGSQNG
jgi:hypothetical protein